MVHDCLFCPEYGLVTSTLVVWLPHQVFALLLRGADALRPLSSVIFRLLTRAWFWSWYVRR